MSVPVFYSTGQRRKPSCVFKRSCWRGDTRQSSGRAGGVQSQLPVASCGGGLEDLDLLLCHSGEVPSHGPQGLLSCLCTCGQPQGNPLDFLAVLLQEGLLERALEARCIRLLYPRKKKPQLPLSSFTDIPFPPLDPLFELIQRGIVALKAEEERGEKGRFSTDRVQMGEKTGGQGLFLSYLLLPFRCAQILLKETVVLPVHQGEFLHAPLQLLIELHIGPVLAPYQLL